MDRSATGPRHAQHTGSLPVRSGGHGGFPFIELLGVPVLPERFTAKVYLGWQATTSYKLRIRVRISLPRPSAGRPSPEHLCVGDTKTAHGSPAEKDPLCFRTCWRG